VRAEHRCLTLDLLRYDLVSCSSLAAGGASLAGEVDAKEREIWGRLVVGRGSPSLGRFLSYRPTTECMPAA
jgi:hypothetical protein